MFNTGYASIFTHNQTGLSHWPYYFSYLLYGYSSILNDRSNVLEVGDAVFAFVLPPTKGVHLVQDIGKIPGLFVFGVHVALPKLKKGS